MMARRPDAFLFAILLAVPLFAGCGSGAGGAGPEVMRWGDDLLGAGSSLSIADSVPGDVMLAGSELTFSGSTGGDYLGAGGRQNVGGRIAGSARAAGGQVTVSAEVGRNATLAGGQVTIADESVIRGNAYVAGGMLRIGGTIDGSVRAGGQTIVLDGTVTGDVDARATTLRVGPNARIRGNLMYTVAEDSLTIDPGAAIGGQVSGHEARRGGGVSFRFLHFLWMLSFIVAGLVVVAVFPGAANTAEVALRARPAAALGFGLLVLLIIPILIAMIALTGIGLALALIIAALYMITVYLSRGVVAIWIGRMLLRGRSRPGRAGIVIEFLIGSVILVLLALIPVIGFIAMLIATVMGLGSLAVALQEREQHAMS